MIGSTTDGSELHLLEMQHADAVSHLKPGDLSQSRGEWLFPDGGAEVFVKQAIQDSSSGRGFWAGIWRKGRLVGVVGLRNINRARATADMDYALDADHRGKGIMTEACRALVSYGFRELGLNRIQLLPDVDNRASCGVPERLGFTKEGIIRDCYRGLSGYRDCAMYAILARDWNDQPRGAG